MVETVRSSGASSHVSVDIDATMADNRADAAPLGVDQLDSTAPVILPAASAFHKPSSTARQSRTIVSEDPQTAMFIRSLEAENKLLRSQIARLKAAEVKFTDRIATTEQQKEELINTAIDMAAAEVGRQEAAHKAIAASLHEEISTLTASRAEIAAQRDVLEGDLAGARGELLEAGRREAAVMESVAALTAAVDQLAGPSRETAPALVDLEPAPSPEMAALSAALGRLRQIQQTRLRTAEMVGAQREADLREARRDAGAAQAEANERAAEKAKAEEGRLADREAFATELGQLTALYNKRIAKLEGDVSRARADAEARTTAFTAAEGVSAGLQEELQAARDTIAALTAQQEDADTTRARLLAELTRLREEGSRATLELDGLKSRQKFVIGRAGQRDLGAMVDRLNREVTRLTEDKARLEEALRGRQNV